MYNEYVMKKCLEKFINTYGREPLDVQFTPYRICPIGAHVDHQLGEVTGFAIDKGIHMAYGPKKNGVVEISSVQFGKRAQFFVSSVPEEKQGDWADHLRGATVSLNRRYPLRVGMCAVIEGELPIGGLSSSAAVIITFVSALCKLNGYTLEKEELIDIAQEAENTYVGVSCGRLDQSCEVYCKKNSLLHLDIKTGKYNIISKNNKMKPFEILVIFSGLERSLTSSKYNIRVNECKSVAYAIKSYTNQEDSDFNTSFLCDVPYELFNDYKDRLPESWVKRAEHYYSEIERVKRGVNAWTDGDIVEFGKIVFESGKSSIELYQTGSDELIDIYDILTKTKGVYGGRFSGAGFKGCCIAFVDPKYRTSIIEEVTEKYCSKYPHLKEKFSIHVCNTADGVKL